MEIQEIFTREELEYLRINRPELIPMDIPSLNDADLLAEPSVDQIIIEFLKKYEVNIEPRSVGAWNGWDTIATLSSVALSRGDLNNPGLNIASTIFYTNRSNQINSAAQDWGTWKRWALDHKNFDKFTNDVLQFIDFHNKKIIEELNEEINVAELNNKKIAKELKTTHAKKCIAEIIKRNKIADKQMDKILLFIIFFIPTCLLSIVTISHLNSSNGKNTRLENNNPTHLAKKTKYISCFHT